MIGTIGTGVGTGWAAYLTKALEGYAPLSWVAAGLIGAFLFVVMFWLWSIARLKVQRRQIDRAYLSPRNNINPLEDVFQKQKINVVDFRRPITDNIRNKTFVDCEVFGPAIVILNGHTTADRVSYIGCDFVKAKALHPIFNAIAFENLTLRNCSVFNVTFLVPEHMVDQIKASPGRGAPNWITP